MCFQLARKPFQLSLNIISKHDGSNYEPLSVGSSKDRLFVRIALLMTSNCSAIEIAS